MNAYTKYTNRILFEECHAFEDIGHDFHNFLQRFYEVSRHPNEDRTITVDTHLLRTKLMDQTEKKKSLDVFHLQLSFLSFLFHHFNIPHLQGKGECLTNIDWSNESIFLSRGHPLAHNPHHYFHST